jgi:glycogen synthase
MNICFVSREFKGSKRAGGIATYVYNTCRALISEGHNVYVICASDNIWKEETVIFQNINLIRLSGADYFLHSNRYIQYVGSKYRGYVFFDKYRKKISKTITDLNNKVGLDIIEFPEFGNESKFWLRESLRIPTITRFHGPSGHNLLINKIDTTRDDVKNELNTAFLSDGISFCSNAIKTLISETDYIKKSFSNFSKSQKIIFNSVSTKNRKISKNIDGSFIFTAGSVCKQKGFGELIEAVRLINETGISIKLIIAGKLGELGLQYKIKAINDSRYSSWLNILGPLNVEDLFYYYKNAKLCCFPSYWDNMPLTCIEAMSVEGLVLGSSSGGMSEIINKDIDGFLVAPKDKILLKNKIIEILCLEKKHKIDIRQAAKKKIQDKFSEKQIVSEMISFYNEVIGTFKTNTNN